MSITTAADFDFLVIGAGSGGVAASRRASLLGARVAIVEGRRVGGTCVLRGCVPKKLLMYAAQAADAFDEARGFGWELPQPRFDMARWAAAKTTETDRLEEVYRKMLADGGIELIEGHAVLDGPGVVRIGERRVTATHVLVATGASPVTDSIPGIEHCATSDDLLDLQQLPERAAVIGGGYIAVEFASMLVRLGVKVDLYFRDVLPLRGFDRMLRLSAAEELQAAGVSVHPARVAVAIESDGQGLTLNFADGERTRWPWVLNATGRRPNSLNLGLDTIGATIDGQGAVRVDSRLRCSITANAYAIGDVSNRKNLTPAAIAEGRALADSLFGPTPRIVDLSRVASAVFAIPPLASIGPSEEELAASGRACQVFEADFRPMKQAFFGGRQRTKMKLIADAQTDEVLAVHMAGNDAPEIVQSLAVGLTAGATKADFDRTLAVHPTAAEEFVLMRQPARSLNLSSSTTR